MKRLLFLLLLLVACSVDTDILTEENDRLDRDRPFKGDKDLKKGSPTDDPSQVVDSQDYYISEEDVGYTLETFDYDLGETSSIYLNEHVDGINNQENTLKLHHTCYSDKLYAATILSPNLAVYDGSSIEYVNTEIASNSFRLKYVICGEENTYVAESPYNSGLEEVELVRIQGGTVIDRASFSSETYLSATNYVEQLGYLFIPVQGTGMLVLDEDMNEVTTLDYEKYSVHYDGTGILFIESRSIDSEIEYYQYDRDLNYVDSGSFSVTGVSRRILYDYTRETVWVSFEDDTMQSYNLYTGEQGEKFEVVPDANDMDISSDNLVVLSDKGFDTDDDGGYLGGITIVNLETFTVQEIKLLHHHTSVSIKDEFVYVTNNDDNSVSKISLDTGEIIEKIDIGNSAEHVVVTKTGDAFVASRLGGNTLFKITPDGDVTELDVGPWPVGMVYDESLDKVFTYNMLAASITEVDSSGTVLREVELPVSEASSDAIGHMSLDETRDLLIISVPEYMEVYLVDASSLELLHIIEVSGEGPGDSGGPGFLQSFMHESSGTLIVYDGKGKVLNYYDGTDSFSLSSSVPINFNKGITDFSYGLFMDQVNSVLYVGNTAYDLNGNIESTLDTNGFVVAVFGDNVLSISKDGKGQEWLHAGTENVMLAKDVYISGRAAYRDGTVYIVYGVQAQVMKLSLY